jgi:ribosomal protein S18 acetylase RimI-like enzyme
MRREPIRARLRSDESRALCAKCVTSARMTDVTVRRLHAGDERVVALLAEREPQTVLLAEERTVFVVAFADEDPVGFAFGYLLPRRHGDAEILFVYEVDVDEGYRRQGIAKRMLRELERVARERGVGEGFVLTEADNDAANRLYTSLGGERLDVVQYEFRYGSP